jgi:hypothetical protein
VAVLSKATSDYARSLANPVAGPLTGIPVHPAQFSKKFRTWVKGAFDVQSLNGIGWIGFSPKSAVTNDSDTCLTSKTGGTQAYWFDFDLGTGQQNQFMSNSEYASAQIGDLDNQFVYRLVSASVRVRYIGTELNRSGQVVGLLDPNHTTLQGRTLSDLDGEETSKRFPVNRDWITVLYRPVDSDDFNFDNAIPTYVPGSGTDKNYFMGFAIQSPIGVSTPFEFECHATFEAFGKNIRAMTPSHVDSTGFAAVHAVSQLGVNLRPTTLPLNTIEKMMVQDSETYVAHGQSTSHFARKKEIELTPALKPTLTSSIAAGIGDAVNIGLGINSILSMLGF